MSEASATLPAMASDPVRPRWSARGGRLRWKLLALAGVVLLLAAGVRAEAPGLLDPTTLAGSMYAVSLGVLITGAALVTTTPLAGLWLLVGAGGLTCAWAGPRWDVVAVTVLLVVAAVGASVPIARQLVAARRALRNAPRARVEGVEAQTLLGEHPSHARRATVTLLVGLAVAAGAGAWTVADAAALDDFRAIARTGTAVVVTEGRTPGLRLDTVSDVEIDGVRYEITTNTFAPAVGDRVEIRYVPGGRAEAVAEMADPHGPLVWGVPALLVPLLTVRWRAAHRRRVVRLTTVGGAALPVTVRDAGHRSLLLDGGHTLRVTTGTRFLDPAVDAGPEEPEYDDYHDDEPARRTAVELARSPRSTTALVVALDDLARSEHACREQDEVEPDEGTRWTWGPTAGLGPEEGLVLGLRTVDDVPLVKTSLGWVVTGVLTDATGADTTERLVAPPWLDGAAGSAAGLAPVPPLPEVDAPRGRRHDGWLAAAVSVVAAVIACVVARNLVTEIFWTGSASVLVAILLTARVRSTRRPVRLGQRHLVVRGPWIDRYLPWSAVTDVVEGGWWTVVRAGHDRDGAAFLREGDGVLPPGPGTIAERVRDAWHAGRRRTGRPRSMPSLSSLTVAAWLAAAVVVLV